jgi:hypothetical protein
MHRFKYEYSRQSADVQVLSTALFHDLSEAERTLDDHDSYVKHGSQRFLGTIRSHQSQRSSTASLDGTAAYQNKRKAFFSSTFKTH